MAAGVTLGFLKYVLGFDSLAFRKGTSQADADLAKLQRSFAARGKSFQKLGKDLTAVVTLPLAGLAAAGIREAQETATAMAQVNASLASMGPVAGRSAAQLQNFANALELKSTFEADQILKDVTATMLTFGKVTGNTFDRAQQAAVDLATKFGKDLPEATVMVGKALQDPIRGITALGRTGIQFSDDQRAVIKSLVETGQTAKAQSMILDELERQVKGSAEAAQNADPWNKLSDAFKSIAESIGTLLLPLVPPLANALASVANWVSSLDPATQKWVVAIGAVAAAAGPALVVLGTLTKAISNIGPAVSALVGAWKALQAGFLIARAAALTTLPALLPYLVPLGAIALAVGAVYLAWKNWDKITAFVKGVYTAAKTWLVDKLNSVWDWVQKKIAAVTGFFKDMWDKVVGHSYVPDMVEAISQEMAKLDGLMVQPAKTATAMTADAFEALKSRVAGILDRLFPQQASDNQFLADLQDLIAYADKAKWSVEQLAKAKQALVSEHFGGSALPDLGDETSLAPQLPDLAPVLATANSVFPKVTAMTREWGDALKEISAGGLHDVVRGLGAVATGQAKLGDVFADTMKRMTAALVEFVAEMLILETVKAIFGANSGPASFISQAFGFGGPRASGGPVMGGTAYLVGEKGPELFLPGTSGRIVPNGSLRAMPSLAGGNVTVHQTFEFQGVAVTAKEFQAGLLATKYSTIDAINQARRRAA